MTKLVFASSNAGKIKELKSILSNYEVIPQAELGVDDADETGLSFVENAIIKARHACEMTSFPALADDSGLEVDALGGAPGIYSSRYSGRGNEANNIKLLAELKDVPETERTARYQCVMVWMRHAKDPVPIICQGQLEGRILFEPRGEGGFGYDPIFYVPEFDCAAAELEDSVKNKISHRAIALQQLTQVLNQK